jgi:hypothetical protein
MMTRILLGLAVCSAALAQGPSQVRAPAKPALAPVKGQCALDVAEGVTSVRLSLPRGAGVAFSESPDHLEMPGPIDVSRRVHFRVRNLTEGRVEFSVVATGTLRRDDSPPVEVRAVIPAADSGACLKHGRTALWVVIGVAAAGGAGVVAKMAGGNGGTTPQPPPTTQRPSINVSFGQPSVAKP